MWRLRKNGRAKLLPLLHSSIHFTIKNILKKLLVRVNFNVLAAETILKLNSGKSMKLIAQHLWTKDDKKNWMAATYEYNFSSRFSVFASDMYNYGNDNTTDKKHFYNFGGNYSKGKTRFSLSYGRQRGGLLCLGGICRVVPEATGFTFTINTSF